MPTTILEHIKGSELPTAWLKKIMADPNQTFTVTLKPEEEMPLEDRISDNLIKAVRESDEDLKAGNYTECKTEKEQEAYFKQVWDD